MAEESVADDSSEAAVEVETGFSDGTFTGEGYTISVDESLWQYTESAGVDCGFTYIGEGDEFAATANLNVVSMSNDALAGLTPSDYAESIREAYDSMEGYNVTAESEGELNGYETYKFTVSYEISGYNMIIDQIIVANDSTLVAISYGAFDSVMEDIEPEFDKIISSFSFT